MNITDLIVELLQQGQKVELPGIGTFDSEVKSPRHDPETRIYYPATRSIVFSSGTTDDMSMVKVIAQRECVGEDVAQQMWRNYTDALSDKIKRTGEHRFGELGTLSLQGEGYTFAMNEGLVIEAGNGNETPLKEVKTYAHDANEDPFAQFEAEPVQVVEKEPEPVEATETPDSPVISETPEISEPQAQKEVHVDNDEDMWKESLKKLDELPKSKAMLKAEAKAEKARQKAEAKAEKERKKLLKRGEKDAEEERRQMLEQQQADAEREAEARRRAEEELREAEKRAEENRRKAEKKEAASMQRAEEKAEEERLKAEKRAAILAAVAASQATKDNVVANASVSASGVDALKVQKEAELRQKESERERKAAEKAAEKELKAAEKAAEKEHKEAEKAAEKERERQLKEEEKRRKEQEKLQKEEEKLQKEEEKRQEKELKRQRKEEAKKAAAVVEPAAPAPIAEEQEERKKHRWMLWLLLLLLLLCGAGAAYYFLKMRHAEPAVTATVGGKHLDVSAMSYFSFNPDMIEYKANEISRNTDQVCANLSEYVMNFLTSRNYTNARVPMMDRVRSYSQERMGKMMGKRYALQHFVPFDDYIYRSSEPWIKQTYAARVRHIVQGELMNMSVLDNLLENLVDELGLQPGTPQRTATEVNQVKETERTAATPKKKKVADTGNPVYVYVEKNSKQGFDIIAGFYLNKTTAAKMTARLHEQGCDAYIIEKNDMYYVSMGSAPTRTKAEALYNHIKSWYDGDIVIKEL